MNILRKAFRYSFFNATLAIIIINTVVFFLVETFQIDKRFFGLGVITFVYNHFFWQAVTYMFIHGDWLHLFFNMLALFIFGIQLERALGSKEFLLMYFTIGILSGLFSVGVYYAVGKILIENGIQPWPFVINLIGASGAIYGLLFAYAVVFPKSIIYIWGILPVPAPIMVIGYAAIEFFSQFSLSSNVAHMTHLAGFAFAWLYFLVRMGVHPIQVWKDAFRR